MCGRYSLATFGDDLDELFDLVVMPALTPRFNIAPTQRVAVVRERQDSRERELVLLRWGLVPAWAKDVSIGQRLINARAETVADKPSFRDAFCFRRCLVLADGYFEWEKVGPAKVPRYFRRRDHRVFAFAGLWDRWTGAGEPIETCAIITTTPNALAAPIHDRMPVVLSPSDFTTWLDAHEHDRERLLPLLRPPAVGDWLIETVSAHVNNPRHDDPACVQPV